MSAEKASTDVSIVRLFRKLLLMVSGSQLIPSTKRYKLLKWAGVNIQGPCFIGAGVLFDSIRPDLITIGEGCVITARTIILSHYLKDDAMFYGAVNIGKRVFVGVNSVILGPRNIGDGAIVGAMSVVTKDIASKQVWAGNPAKYIKDREIDL